MYTFCFLNLCLQMGTCLLVGYSSYYTSGLDDQVNFIVAWYCCSMSQRTSLIYLTDIEITKVSLSVMLGEETKSVQNLNTCARITAYQIQFCIEQLATHSLYSA